PNSLPFIVVGLRLAIGRAILGVVVAEVFGAQDGLDVWMFRAASSFKVDVVFAGLVVFAALSLLMTGLVKIIEDRMSRWRPQRSENEGADSAPSPQCGESRGEGVPRFELNAVSPTRSLRSRPLPSGRRELAFQWAVFNSISPAARYWRARNSFPSASIQGERAPGIARDRVAVCRPATAARQPW